MVWGVLECLGNRGRLGLPTGGWDGEEGVHADTSDRRDGRGLGGVGGAGGSWGSAGVPGSWQGQDQGAAGMDGPNCMSGSRGEGGRTLLSP